MKLKTSHCISLLVLAFGLVAAFFPVGFNHVAAAVNPDQLSLSKTPSILDLDLRVFVAGKPVYLILVEKDKQRLRVLKHDGRLRVLAEYVTATGANLGPKVVEGDSKTPEGIYFINKIYTDNKISVFGSRAFHLDYPNVFDEEAGRSGNGIFIHGTNKELRSNSSNGCITLKNPDLDELAGFLNIETTPVIVVSSLEELAQGKNLDFVDTGFEMAKAVLIPNEIDRRRVTFDSLYFLNFRGQTIAVGEFQAGRDGGPPQKGISRSYLGYTEKKGWAVKKQIWHPASTTALAANPLAGATPNVTMAPVTTGVTAFAEHWAKLWQWPEVEAYAGIFEHYLNAQAKMTLAEPTPALPKVAVGLGGWRLLGLALLSLGVSLASAWGFMQGKSKKIPVAGRRDGLEELFQERGRQINAFQAEISGLSYELNLLQTRAQGEHRSPEADRLRELEEALAGKERELKALAAGQEGMAAKEELLASQGLELEQLRDQLLIVQAELVARAEAEERLRASFAAEKRELLARQQTELERLRRDREEAQQALQQQEQAAFRLVEVEAQLAAKSAELAELAGAAVARQEAERAEAARWAESAGRDRERLAQLERELARVQAQAAESELLRGQQLEAATRLGELERLVEAKNAELELARLSREEAEAKRQAEQEVEKQELLARQEAERAGRSEQEAAAERARQQQAEMTTRLQGVEARLAAATTELAESRAAATRQAAREVEQQEARAGLEAELSRLREQAGAAAQLATQQQETAARLLELEAQLAAKSLDLAELAAEKSRRQETEVAEANRRAALEAGHQELMARLEAEMGRLRDKEKEAEQSRRQQAEAEARLPELEGRLAEQQGLVVQLREECARAKLKAEEVTEMTEEREIIREELDALQEQLREERKKLRFAEEKNIRIPELLQALDTMKLEIESLIAENRTLQAAAPGGPAVEVEPLARELAETSRRLAELEEAMAEKDAEISQLLVKNSALKAKAVMAGGIAGAGSAAEELGRLRQELASEREGKLSSDDLAGRAGELERLLALKNEEIAELSKQLAAAGSEPEPESGRVAELTTLQAELAAERQARLAAETANQRIPALEEELAALESELDQLTAPQPPSATTLAQAEEQARMAAEMAELRGALASERQQRLAAEEQNERLGELEQRVADKDALLAELTRVLDEQLAAASRPPAPAAGGEVVVLQAELAALQEKVAKQAAEIKQMQAVSDEGAVLIQGSHYIPGAVLRAWTKS